MATVITQGQKSVDGSGINQFNPNTGKPLAPGQSVTINPVAASGSSGTTDRVNGVSQNPNVPNANGTPYTPGAIPPVNTSQPNPVTEKINPPNAPLALPNGTTNPTPQGTVPYDQAQKGLLSGGLQGADLTNAQDNLKRVYQQGLQNAQDSGKTPTDSGTGQVQDHLPQTPPDNSQAQAVIDDNKAHQQYINDYQQGQEQSSQRESLTDEYKRLSDQSGIPQLNTELMNMNNVINGTEQDIRDEVTKAGGFATNSQVLALASARNKTLIQNYNDLLETRTNLQKNLDTMIGLAEQDRAYASSQIDKQLNFDQQNMQFADKALTNSQDALTSMQKTEGWDGIYKAALASGDPQAIDRINSIMGNGFDLVTASQNDMTSAKSKLELQQATLNLAKTGLDIKKTQQDLNDSSGLPNPAKANQVGYNAQGIKYNTTNATQEIITNWKNQKAFDPTTQKIPPAFYNNAKAAWVQEGLTAADFDAVFGGYKDPNQDNSKNKLYN